MKSKCCGQPLTTYSDGCLRVIKRCTRCGAFQTQRKRRPASSTPEDCTWVIPCANHPDK